MPPKGRQRGHRIEFDYDAKVWIYSDTGRAIAEQPDRACKLCGLGEGFDGPDPCLGRLPGVKNACCGHGDRRRAYIQFEDGTIVRGFATIERAGR